MPVKRRCVSCRDGQRSCDLQRPRCGRCAAKAVECTYPDTPKFSFVDQNGFSAELSRRAASRRYRNPIVVTFDVHAPPQAGSLLVNARENAGSPALLSPPKWTLDEQVLNRFLILWTAGYTSLGSFDFISKIYADSGEKRATKSAVLAVAYADLALLECHGDYVNKSYEAYHSTICRIRDHLRDTSARNLATDNILTSILVIDSYELLYMRRPAPLGSHTSAIVRFLQLRREEARYDKRSVEMWRAAYPRLQARQLLCGLRSFDESIGAREMMGSNPLDVQVSKFVARACDAIHSLRIELQAASDADEASSELLTQQGNELSRLLQDTVRMLSEDDSLPRMREIDVSRPLHPFWPGAFKRTKVLVCDRFWIARDWILLHMGRIKILDLLLDVDDHISRHSSAAGPTTKAVFDLDRRLALYELNDSCRYLVDIMPFLMGLTSGATHNALAHFRDTGLLIAHYPLWTIKQSKNAWCGIKRDVDVLLGFLETYRSIIGR